MRVDPEDGQCRTCQGTLTIIDADDVTMTVQCDDCGDTYDVETDALGDGCMKYYFPFMLARQEEAGGRSGGQGRTRSKKVGIAATIVSFFCEFQKAVLHRPAPPWKDCHPNQKQKYCEVGIPHCG